MAYKSEINDVPPAQVDQVVQDFKIAGAAKVDKTQQPDGNYTVIATFDDAKAGAEAEAEAKKTKTKANTKAKPTSPNAAAKPANKDYVSKKPSPKKKKPDK
jgi:hypothetical protein